MSGTPLRSIRIDDATWARIKARAARLGMSASQYIISRAEEDLLSRPDREQLAQRCAALSRQIAQVRQILELEK